MGITRTDVEIAVRGGAVDILFNHIQAVLTEERALVYRAGNKHDTETVWKALERAYWYGHADGCMDGWEAAMASVDPDTILDDNDVWNDGWTAGYASGSDDGFTAGWDAVQQQETHGQIDVPHEYNRGHADGCMDGWEAIPDNEPHPHWIEGHEDGYWQGYHAGILDPDYGEPAGLQAGWAAAEECGAQILADPPPLPANPYTGILTGGKAFGEERSSYPADPLAPPTPYRMGYVPHNTRPHGIEFPPEQDPCDTCPNVTPDNYPCNGCQYNT